MEMFEASVNGELYDPDRWGAHYKPSGFKIDSANTTESTPVTDNVPFDPTPAPKFTPAVTPTAPAAKPAPAGQLDSHKLPVKSDSQKSQ